MIFLAGVVVLMLATGEYILTFAYPFVAFLFALAVYNKIREQPWLYLLEDLGRNSLVVYLAHTSIQNTVVMKYLYNAKFPWELELPVVVGATVILSYVFARVFMFVYHPVISFFMPVKQMVAVENDSRKSTL